MWILISCFGLSTIACMNVHEDDPVSRWIRIDIDETGFTVREDSTYLSPEEILRLKPAVVADHLTDTEWIVVVRMRGFSRTISGLFKMYAFDQADQGLVQLPGPRAENPGETERVFLGKAGEETYRSTGGIFLEEGGVNPLFESYFMARDWQPEQLGLFGQFLQVSGVDPRFAKPIIHCFIHS